MASGYHAGQSRHQTRSPSRKLRLDNAVLTFESRQEAAAKSRQCPLGLHVPPPLPASPPVERNPARWDGHPHLQPDCPASTTHTPTTAGCLRGRQAWGQVLDSAWPKGSESPANGLQTLTEPLSLLCSADGSLSFEALAVSEGAACVLEELPWDDLFSVSVFTSESASC